MCYCNKFLTRPNYVRHVEQGKYIFIPGRNEVNQYSFHPGLNLMCDNHFFLTRCETENSNRSKILCVAVLLDTAKIYLI